MTDELLERMSSSHATTLELSQWGLAAIPPAVLDHKQLVCLNLEANKIETVPDGIASLDSLQELNLNGNPLQHISPALFQMHSLKRLYLYGSIRRQISLLPQLSALENLIELNLDDNALCDEPDEPGAKEMQEEASDKEGVEASCEGVRDPLDEAYEAFEARDPLDEAFEAREGEYNVGFSDLPQGFLEGLTQLESLGVRCVLSQVYMQAHMCV